MHHTLTNEERLDFRLRGCVAIQKSIVFMPVMPDTIRHPELQHRVNSMDSGLDPE